MKNNLILLIIIILTIGSINAQKVRYNYKSLKKEGATVEFSVSKQDTTFYLFTTLHTWELIFPQDPIMLLKTFNNDIIKLKGKSINNTSQSSGFIAGSVVIPITELISIVQFPITPQQFELLKMGISKIRLNTIPTEHEKTFKKDKIGKKLYKLYTKQKYKNEDF